MVYMARELIDSHSLTAVAAAGNPRNGATPKTQRAGSGPNGAPPAHVINGSAIRAFVQQKKTLPSDSFKPVIAAALPTGSADRREPAFSSFESEHRLSVCPARRSVQSAIWV